VLVAAISEFVGRGWRCSTFRRDWISAPPPPRQTQFWFIEYLIFDAFSVAKIWTSGSWLYVSEKSATYAYRINSALKMETVASSETSITTYQTIQCRKPEDHNTTKAKFRWGALNARLARVEITPTVYTWLSQIAGLFSTSSIKRSVSNTSPSMLKFVQYYCKENSTRTS
jgi:hypothetical protein